MRGKPVDRMPPKPSKLVLSPPELRACEHRRSASPHRGFRTTEIAHLAGALFRRLSLRFADISCDRRTKCGGGDHGCEFSDPERSHHPAPPQVTDLSISRPQVRRT